MAKLIVDGPDLVVGLSWLEKLGSVHKDVRVPLRTVRKVEVEPHPWLAVRGVFIAVLARRPAIRVELAEEAPFSQLLVSVRDPEATVAAIRAATGV